MLLVLLLLAVLLLLPKGKMKRRDWLAALSLLSTRRRLDLRSPLFRAFAAAALQQQELLQAPHIHLTIHR